MYFFLRVKSKLDKVGFVQSPADPCIFISDIIIYIVYADDYLSFVPNDS